jgi:hypothetical protein
MIKPHKERLEYQRTYSKRNREKILEYNREYYRKRREIEGYNTKIKSKKEIKVNIDKVKPITKKIKKPRRKARRRLLIGGVRIRDRPLEEVIETKRGFLLIID